MKIYSWNMLYRNADPDRAFSFIQNLDFDVLCLQEVPEKFLEHLKTLPLNVACGIDIERFEYGTVVRNSCIILTRHKIHAKRSFLFPHIERPFRTRSFLYLMWRLRGTANRGSVFADIEFPNLGLVRIFCLHLTLAYPRRRMLEFNTAMELRDSSLSSIVCGDLNILESPRVTVLNWFLGGRLRDIFAWRSERRDMEMKFAQLKLQNPLRGKPTQTISNSQLDHILVPFDFKVVHAEVLPDRVGSDHHPVFVECV